MKEQERDSPRPRGERVSDVTRTLVHRAAIEALSPLQRAKSTLYMDPRVVLAGTRVGLPFAGGRVQRNCVLTFADHEPRANFAHPCAYYLHDVESGELVTRVPARFPPFPREGLHQLELFYEPIRRLGAEGRGVPTLRRSKRRGPKHTLSGSGATRYAILFAGEAEAWHLNDLELYRRTLILQLGFAPENVYTLFNDGSTTSGAYFDRDGNARPYPGPRPPAPAAAADPDHLYDTQFPAPSDWGSREGFQRTLRKIQPKLKANDLLFILTEGHGEQLFKQNSTVEECLVSIPDGQYGDRYTSSEMKADLMTLGTASFDSLLVVMNQCYSEGFRADILASGSGTAQRTFFAYASGADQMAYTNEDYRWNEFSRHWIEAERRAYIESNDAMPADLDGDGDGKIDAIEALVFCQDTNTCDFPNFDCLPPPPVIPYVVGGPTSKAQDITLA